MVMDGNNGKRPAEEDRVDKLSASCAPTRQGQQDLLVTSQHNHSCEMVHEAMGLCALLTTVPSARRQHTCSHCGASTPSLTSAVQCTTVARLLL